MTDAEILANKALREEAEGIVELLGDKPTRFWEELRKLVETKLPASFVPPEKIPMEREEAMAFRRLVMPYGAHAGLPLHHLPRSYLAAVIDRSKFSIDLERYVRSSFFSEHPE